MKIAFIDKERGLIKYVNRSNLPEPLPYIYSMPEFPSLEPVVLAEDARTFSHPSVNRVDYELRRNGQGDQCYFRIESTK